ncbi:MAG TPA: glycosyltransferase [Anaerolineaceae bacterium]|jgi:glycosyltransferase involved in cell wall biosynthesis
MPASNPLFSVIIPTYNRAQKVVRAVESVLAQTFTNFDVWVIDDGSTDDTAQALTCYEGRIHYCRQKNAGASSARNRGVRSSTGKYIAFLDSDDRWAPQKLESMAAEIATHPDTGLFYSACDVVDEAGARLWIDHSRAVQGSAYLPLLMGNFLALSSAVARRDCLERAGEFDPAMIPCEDWDVWLRIARWYSITLVPEVLVIFEYASADKLTAHTRKWLEAHDKVIEKTLIADRSIGPGMRQVVQANQAYIKGRIWMEARDNRKAASWFRDAIKLRPVLFRAYPYYLLCSIPGAQGLLPESVRRRLRLPAPERKAG